MSFLEQLHAANTPTKTLEDHYQEHKNTPRDIDKDLENLYNLGLECENIVELGTRFGSSTTAFLRAKPKKFTAVDIVLWNEATPIFDAGRAENPDMIIERVIGDSRTIDLEEMDGLFIDTQHDYDVLKEELTRHGNKARIWIAMHDLISFATHNECKPGPGLRLAVDEFLKDNPHWYLDTIYSTQNGVAVLRRR